MMEILPSTYEVVRRLKNVGELCAQYLEMVETLRPREVSDLRQIKVLVRRIAREIDGACRVIEEMELPPSAHASVSAFLGSLRDLESSYRVLESALQAMDKAGINAALAAIGIAAHRVGREGDCWVMYMVHLLEHADRQENP